MSLVIQGFFFLALPSSSDAVSTSAPWMFKERGTSRLMITKEYHGPDIQLEAIGGKALGTSEGALP